MEKALVQKPEQRGGYVWSNKDSVRVDNWNHEKQAPHPKFCVDCFYLINVKAVRRAEGTIIIPIPGVEIDLG